MINTVAIKQAAGRTMSRGLLVTRKYSPEILTSVGVVGVVAAAVFAAKATLSLEPIVDQVKHNLDGVDENDKKAKARVMMKGAVDISKLYGPSVTLGLVSITCIVSAHGIMRRRNVALVAALNVVEKSYAKYRQAVIDEFGEEKDQEFRMGFKDTVVKDEDGKDKTVTVVDEAGAGSPYARLFSELSSRHWQKGGGYNRMFVNNIQMYANDRLRARGYVFLNDVFDDLGMERTKAGQTVGWVWEKDNPLGDNVIDFGVYDFSSPNKRDFISGYEDSVMLDFNVDGDVLSRIKF